MAKVLDAKTLDWINKTIEDVEFLEKLNSQEIFLNPFRTHYFRTPINFYRHLNNLRMTKTGRPYCGEVLGLNNPLKLNISTTTLMSIKGGTRNVTMP